MRPVSFEESFAGLLDNIERIIQGKRDAIHLALVCLLADGHLLIEDVPGVGKTSLAKAIARSIDGTWRRIQCSFVTFNNCGRVMTPCCSRARSSMARMRSSNPPLLPLGVRNERIAHVLNATNCGGGRSHSETGGGKEGLQGIG